MPNRPQKSLRKNTRFIIIDGEKKPIAEWAEESGVPLQTIVKRIQRGWNGLEAVFCPVEDEEFCLARKTILAHASKTRVDSKPERWPGEEEQMFNIWAAIMNRCGNTHMIYQQAVAIARETGQMPAGL